MGQKESRNLEKQIKGYRESYLDKGQEVAETDDGRTAQGGDNGHGRARIFGYDARATKAQTRTAMALRRVAHLPADTPILAYADTTTDKGRAVRLYVSDPWQHRIWGLQVVVAVDAKDVKEGEVNVPNDERILGDIRVIWTTTARITAGAPSLGEYAARILGKLWMANEERHDEFLAGRPFYDAASKKQSELRGAWEELWSEGARRNIGWVEYANVEKEERRQGLASIMYPAIAQILDKEGVGLVRSTLASAQAEAYWNKREDQCMEVWVAGEKRAQIKPGSLDWKY